MVLEDKAMAMRFGTWYDSDERLLQEKRTMNRILAFQLCPLSRRGSVYMESNGKRSGLGHCDLLMDIAPLSDRRFSSSAVCLADCSIFLYPRANGHVTEGKDHLDEKTTNMERMG